MAPITITPGKIWSQSRERGADLPSTYSRFIYSWFSLCFLYRKESIGITTGRAFCGVVGHLDRHEYTGKLS